jgi:prefoldin subunit 5
MGNAGKIKNIKDYKKRLNKLQKSIDKLNSEIAEKSDKFKEVLALRNINYKDVAKALKKDDLYIDYAKTKNNYYIFTLNKKGVITFNQIDSKNSKQIDNLVQNYRKNINSILHTTNISKKRLNELTVESKKILSKLYNSTFAPKTKQISRCISQCSYNSI